ncbi:MAG TPA: nuclear transport factor 2 family protein [Terriglobales bacterium]|nr:nuclear transport factor 2 family protein [Terriglobales bacterium]
MKPVIAVVIAVAIFAGIGTAQHKKNAPETSTPVQGNVAEQLEQIEHKWAESEVKADPAMIAPYLDDTMMQTNPDGSVSPRKEVLDGIGKGDPTLKAVDLDDLKTQSYGDAAVIMGRYTEKRETNGKHVMTAGRFTDTYVKRGGKWKCVASHDSVAVKE